MRSTLFWSAFGVEPLLLQTSHVAAFLFTSELWYSDMRVWQFEWNILPLLQDQTKSEKLSHIRGLPHLLSLSSHWLLENRTASSPSHLAFSKRLDSGWNMENGIESDTVIEHSVERLQDLDCNFSIKNFPENFNSSIADTSKLPPLHAFLTKCIELASPSLFDNQGRS